MDADGDGLLNNGSNLFVTGTKKAEDGTVGWAAPTTLTAMTWLWPAGTWTTRMWR